MSSLMVQGADGTILGDEQLTSRIKRRLQSARDYRRRFEPGWHSSLAFAAGKHWLEWDRFNRQLVLPPELRGKELYTADVITEYRMSALAELGSDDDRPELLLRRDDQPSEDYAEQLNRAVSFGWDSEWRGDDMLAEVDRITVDLGTAGMRCRFDPTVGPPAADNVPHYNGKPVLNPGDASALFKDGPNPDVKMRPIRQGRICWEPLSPFNILVPPGIPNEDSFPWEAVVRPVPLEKVQAEYGDLAKDLKEDADIGSILGLDSQSADLDIRASMTGQGGGSGKLRDHVWLFTYYERPTAQWPNGRTVTLGGNRMTLLRFDDRLPYVAPDGSYRSGIAYFHWWRVTGRFWSRGLVEVMKDAQRGINKRRTQINEIVDRGMPFLLVEKDSAITARSGMPVEFVELRKGETQPIPVPGVAPGPWMQADVEAIREDLDHATGIKAVRLGENPANVSTYSQLALINENDQAKRQTIVSARKQAISRLVEDSVYDIRTYWGSQRQIMLAGDENQVDAHTFDATRVPTFFIVRVAKGAALPRSQAAEISKIDTIWQAAVKTGVAVAPGENEKWVRWYSRSLDAGTVQELPELESDSQAEVAAFENFLMLEQGEQPPPSEYDLAPVHIPVHREAQDHARAAGDQASFQRLQTHIEQHVDMVAATRKAWRVYDPTDMQDLASDAALDEDQALRENQLLLAGVPLNPEALQQAIAAVKQGQDPATGQPLAEGADPRTILISASLKPTLVENLQVHLDRHGKVIKSKQFQSFPQDARGRFIDHFNQTRDLWLSIPQMPAEVTAPKVSLALRESVGPSTIAEVLRRAGVPDADAQQLATEPPMENMVKRDDPPVAADQTGEHYPPRGPL